MTDSNKAYVYALLTVLFWSTVATAFKLALESLDIFQLLFFASLCSCLVLFIPVLVQSKLSLLKSEFFRHWRFTILVSLLNPLLYYIVLFAAYDRLPAQIVQPINYTWAIVLTFMSVLLLKQKPNRRDFIAAFVCYAGVLVIATQGQLSPQALGDVSREIVFGISLAVLSTFIWAYYWVLNFKDPRDHRVAMCLNFVVALPTTFVVCAIFSDFDVSIKGVLSAAYIGIFEMGLAFLFWSKALRLAVNTARVSTLIFLSPFLSLYFVHQILGEKILATTYIGLVIIVAGLLLQRLDMNVLKTLVIRIKPSFRRD